LSSFFDPEDAEEPDFSRFPEKLRILTADARSKGLDEVVVVRPEEAVAEGIVLNKWLAYWMSVAQAFAKELGLREDEILFEEKLPEERAHYSKQTFDQLVSISRWGWVEISGHAYRTDYDLSRHMQFSGEDMTVYRELKKPKEVTKKSVVIDQELLKEYFGSDTPRVLQALRRLSVEEVEKILSEGEVIVDGFKVPARVFRIEEVKEVVRGRRFIPHVVEPSFGAERLLLVVLDKAYYEEGGRVVLKLPPKLAPYKLAVFPLIPKEESLRTLARRIYHDAVKAGLTVIYDEDGSIGRRYARVDEIGVPFAVTVDYQSLEDNTVTVRFRDSREQIRIKSDEVIKWVLNNL